MKVSATLHRVLARSEQARNSDKAAILEIWEEWGLHLSQTQRELFLSFPSVESIRRTRQKMQEEGLYPAVKRIKKERNFKAMSMQQRAPQATPENIVAPLEFSDFVDERIYR